MKVSSLFITDLYVYILQAYSRQKLLLSIRFFHHWLINHQKAYFEELIKNSFLKITGNWKSIDHLKIGVTKFDYGASVYFLVSATTLKHINPIKSTIMNIPNYYHHFLQGTYSKFQNKFSLSVMAILPWIQNRLTHFWNMWCVLGNHGLGWKRSIRAKSLSTDYNESNKPTLESLVHIESEKSLVELGFPNIELLYFITFFALLKSLLFIPSHV